MCEPHNESEEPEGSEERSRWTSYQKWSLGLAGAGVIIPIVIGAAQFIVR